MRIAYGPALLVLAALSGCLAEPSALPDEQDPATVSLAATAAAAPSGAGFDYFQKTVQPALATQCAGCHVGKRFAFASLQRAGTTFTSAETAQNYDAFFDLISLDSPEQSRLLAKLLPLSDGRAIQHAGGNTIKVTDALYKTLLTWIQTEKTEKCADCGLTATKAYVGYVEQPKAFWAIDPSPSRNDWGYRLGARIMLQPINPATMQPTGAPIDFLNGTFCGARNECDFGQLAVNHAGTQMAFECRLSLTGEDWMNLAWNMCIAEIGSNGRAVNPRFLMPNSLLRNWTVARSTPFGVVNSKAGANRYNGHLQTRRREDRQPVFSADDQRLLFSSRRADPRSGETGVETYHGFNILNNIVSAGIDGSNLATVYRNEGGSADYPTLLKNGNVAFHTWNLERIDSHMYAQSRADGNVELPVLFGRTQGPNMWGKLIQLSNGSLVGTTGRRRGSISIFELFWADHTLGTGIDRNFTSFKLLHPSLDQEMDAALGSGGYAAYCDNPMAKGPANTKNCHSSKFFDDVAYSPDGRALATYNPSETYYSNDDAVTGFYQNYRGSGGDKPTIYGGARGGDINAITTSMNAWLPANMGIGLVDMAGNAQVLLAPPSGKSLRFPTWVGKRQRPRVQASATDETQNWVELHIADFPLWLTFARNEQNKAGSMTTYDKIVSVRVLYKEAGRAACENDRYPYRNAVNLADSNLADHPTALGINNATGYTQLALDAAHGGNAYGEIPLQSDKSVRMRLPGGKLLLLQGVDKDGRVIAQHDRVFALPPGQRIDTSVKRSQYESQCGSCHGVVTSGATYKGLASTASLAAGMDFNTTAATAPVVDLTSSAVELRTLTFQRQVRPLLNARCVSCHNATTPAGELSLVADYSTTGNYPAGTKWSGFADPAYLNFITSAKRTPAYNFSVAMARVITEGSELSQVPNAYAPLAALAPWDSGYQNLFAGKGRGLYYLDRTADSNFGRQSRVPHSSASSFLIEILTGQDLDPTVAVGGTHDHTKDLSAAEIRRVMAVLDVGFPFMAKCDDKTVPSGPNQGKPWGDPVLTEGFTY